jgi:hypothetical protein
VRILFFLSDLLAPSLAPVHSAQHASDKQKPTLVPDKILTSMLFWHRIDAAHKSRSRLAKTTPVASNYFSAAQKQKSRHLAVAGFLDCG